MAMANASPGTGRRTIIRQRRTIAVLLLALLVSACATSPTGRQQLQLFPDSQIRSMGLEAYAQMREDGSVIRSGPQVDHVQCVTDAIVPYIPAGYADNGWEVSVFESDQVNAFALPGGKMGVYTGLLDVAETDDQLAAVVAHEIAHVMAEHANERMSTEFATVLGLGALQIAAGDDPERQRTLAVTIEAAAVLYARERGAAVDHLAADVREELADEGAGDGSGAADPTDADDREAA